MGSELSAASGRSSEVSEWPRSKFPASAVRQHRNFGHRNRVIVPYGGIQGVREKNPPVTALPCQPPLGKGALRTGDADCHSRCAHRLRNDRLQELRSVVGGGVRAPRPMHFVGGRCKAGRVVREADPYGSVTGRASGIGRGRTPPLRRVTRGAVGRDDVGIVPYGIVSWGA